jgi:hypothetical protein
VVFHDQSFLNASNLIWHDEWQVMISQVVHQASLSLCSCHARIPLIVSRIVAPSAVLETSPYYRTVKAYLITRQRRKHCHTRPCAAVIVLMRESNNLLAWPDGPRFDLTIYIPPKPSSLMLRRSIKNSNNLVSASLYITSKVAYIRWGTSFQLTDWPAANKFGRIKKRKRPGKVCGIKI